MLQKYPKFELLDQTILNLGTAWYSQAQGLFAQVSSVQEFPLAHTRHALRDAQQVAGATGTSFAQTTLVRPRSASRNRLMRPRMSGRVGRAISNGGPYPISASLLRLRWFP